MATFVFTDAYVEINSVDMSGWIKSVAVDLDVEMVDDTVMGHAARSSKPGLLANGFQIEAVQDFAASAVDATLWAIRAAGVAVAVEVRPTSGARSATNPGYTNAAMALQNYKPLGQQVGELALAPATFVNAGPTGFQRQTS